MMLGFKFQLQPRMEGFCIYSTLKYFHEHTVHQSHHLRIKTVYASITKNMPLQNTNSQPLQCHPLQILNTLHPYNQLTGAYVCNGQVLSSANNTISRNANTTDTCHFAFCFRLDPETLVSSIIMLQQPEDDTWKSYHHEYIRHKHFKCPKTKSTGKLLLLKGMKQANVL